MSTAIKIGNGRQLSLRCETPSIERRKTLKKQFSEDIPDSKSDIFENEPKIRISLSAKARLPSRPIIRQAWTEKTETKKEDALVTTKCKELKRPKPKFTKQASLDSDSILNSCNTLTNRLRQVWNEREKEKQNLDIFLTHTTREKEESGDCPESEPLDKIPPKLMLPLRPEILHDENNIKNIFQKQIRKHNRLAYCDAAPAPFKPDPRNNTVVIVPLVVEPEQERPAAEVPKTAEESASTRPSSTATRRQSFQKRTNSAFNGSITHSRAPLIRASSVPSRPQQSHKFVATKRRLKTTKRRSSSKAGSKCGSDEECDGSVVGDYDANLGRSVSVTGTDVVTMVSLVSPSASDTDELEEKEVPKEKKSLGVTNEGKKNEKVDLQQRTMMLRKTMKQVSFQQSSMHSIRSFSASIPARRNSTGLLHGSYGLKLNNMKTQEKRSTANFFSDTEESVAKKRLLRTQSIDCSHSFPPPTDTQIEGPNKSDEDAPKEAKSDKTTEVVSRSTEEETSINPNEKKCWELYRKMSDKGVCVSFDTILRGMLTPTEYRLHRNQSLAIEDNC